MQTDAPLPDALSTPPEDTDADPAALFRAALASHQTRDLVQAESLYLQVLDAAPQHTAALNLLGVTRIETGQPAGAVEVISQAIALEPWHPDAYIHRGIAWTQLNRPEEALVDIDEALRLRPDSVAARHNRGNVLCSLGRPHEALACYDRVVQLEPNHTAALYGRGRILVKLNRPDEAMRSFEAVLRLKPDDGPALDKLVQLMCNTCQWDRHAERIHELIGMVTRGHYAVSPFSLLALSDDAGLQYKAAHLWQARYPAGSLPSKTSGPSKHKRRLHIAYLCGEFRQHATTFLMAQVLESHDRSRFELTGIALHSNGRDAMSARIANALDRMIDAEDMPDSQVAALCRELGVDVAVDLNGLAGNCRPGALAARCAPVQINWLAYPGTTGATCMDYIVADRTLITDDDLVHYSEKVIWLPHTYQPNDITREIAQTPVTRAACGLPEHGFVFCCFNAAYKIQPWTFDVWMRILHRVPGSVLWLLADNPHAWANLRNEAVARGVTADRLVFAERLPLPEHLARHALADLFLDTWPYNAHTTASDALWAGLPVLTFQGRAFAGRVAASLLRAVGFPELVTLSPPDFEALAVALAQDPKRLADLKARLRAQRLQEPLFDPARFTRNLESAYTEVAARATSGRAPDHLQVHEASPAPRAHSRSRREPGQVS